MPLIQSPKKKAFEENVKTEMEANPGKKNRAQNLAIAYSVQRKNKGKKKMAEGGEVSEGTNDKKELAQENSPKALHDSTWTDNNHDSTEHEEAETGGEGHIDESSDHTGETMEDMLRRHADEIQGLANGGMVGPDESEPHSLAEKIMHSRRMAAGGTVDLEANSEESPNMEDKYSFEANGKEQYDLSQLSKQPEDSNEHGDAREEESENKHDRMDAMRAKIRAKRGM